MQRVRLGVVGCGAIAQIQHLPNLASLQEEFEVVMVCDVSPSLARWAAEHFHVPHHVTDFNELLAAEAEAVLLCHGDPKTEVAIAAFEAGKHVFIEKPMCFSLREADAIIQAARGAGTVGQMGYMKVFDPAFERAQRDVQAMDSIRFVQVNHLHTSNAKHIGQFRVQRFDDIPPEAYATLGDAREVAVGDALGKLEPQAKRAFFILAGSMIHDLYGLRVMLGQPERVVSTEIWNEGHGISTVFEYSNGARAVSTWVELPHVWDFRETLEVYGDSRRVLISYPTGFARGILSEVTIHGVDESGESFRRQPAVAWESAFRRELRHFHACITEGVSCRTSVDAARDDIALIIDIIRAYGEG